MRGVSMQLKWHSPGGEVSQSVSPPLLDATDVKCTCTMDMSRAIQVSSITHDRGVKM